MFNAYRCNGRRPVQPLASYPQESRAGRSPHEDDNNQPNRTVAALCGGLPIIEDLSFGAAVDLLDRVPSLVQENSNKPIVARELFLSKYIGTIHGQAIN
jgi:hypothetical protein